MEYYLPYEEQLGIVMNTKNLNFHRSRVMPNLIALLLLVILPQFVLAQGGEYLIAKGDQMLVTVWGYSEFTTTSTVRDNGMFAMPLLGEIKAAGLTKDEFIAALKKKLAEYIQGEVRVTVSIVSSIGQRVTILGAVARPDNYPISSQISLLELLTMAGGPRTDARLSRIKIVHKDKLQPSSEVDLESYLDEFDIENIPKVQPGDLVFVPVQHDFVKELGTFLGSFTLLLALFRLTGA